MSGNEKIYSFTPTSNLTNVQVSMTNIQDNFSGLFILDDTTLTGNCMASITNIGSADRIAANLSLVANTTYYFIVSSWANPQCLDYDFQVLDQTCPAPAMVMDSATTDVSTYISWTEMGAATNWEVQYGVNGFVLGTGTVVPAATNPVQITGLTAQTEYDFYVRAACNATDSSYWVGPYTAETGCTPLASFSEDFLGFPTGQTPDCWTSTAYSTNNFARSYVYQYGTPHSGNRHIYMTNSNDPAANLFFVYPKLTNAGAGTHRTRFYAKGFSGNDLILGVMTDPNDSATFTPVDTITVTSTYTEYIIDFDSYVGSAEYVAVRLNNTAWYQSVYLDDIIWEQIPSCYRPSNLTAFSLGTTADLSWTENNGATNWEVEYGPAGFVQGAGTSVLTSTNPTTITGLTIQTDYDYYVRTGCAMNDSSTWEGPFTFTTPCVPTAAPDTNDVEGFSATTNSTIGNCWSSTPNGTTGSTRWNVDASGSTPSGSTGPSGAFSGSKYFYLETSNGSNGDFAELVTTLYDLSALTSPRIQFMYHMYGATINKLVVEINDGTGWIAVDSILGRQHNSAAAAWSLRNIYLPTLTGTIQIKFKGYKGASYTGDISLDDIMVNNGPSCLPPNGLTASAITSSSLDFEWMEIGSATQWHVEYDTAGFTPGTGTTVLTTVNPLSVTGLSPVTSYDFYVRSICGATDSSTWEGPYNLMTQPTCPDVDSLSVSNVTGTSADLAWVEMGSATQWEYEYGPAGYTFGASGFTLTTSNPLSITGLNGGSPYDFYVKAICGPGDSAEWVGPYTFSTLCITQTIRYQQDFNNWPLNCWDMSGGTRTWSQYGSTGIAEASFWSWTNGNNGYMTSMDIAVTTDAQIVFDWSHLFSTFYPNDSLRVDIKKTSASTWTQVWGKKGSDLNSNDGAGNTTPGSFVTETIILDTTYTNDTVQVRFYAHSGWGPDLFLDNFAIEPIPTCSAPLTLFASNVNSSGATLGWTETGTSTQWEIEYGAPGFFVGTGTGTSVLTTTNPHAITGLTPQTPYQFYVRAVCSATDSSFWSGPYDFVTGCSPMTAYNENFDSWAAYTIEPCWTSLVVSSATSAFVQSYAYSTPNSGNRHIRFYNQNDASADMFLISPELSNLSAGTHRTKFFARSFDNYDIIVGTMSDPMDSATFTPWDTVTANSSYNEYKVSFAGYTGTDTYIAYKPIHTLLYDYTYIDDAVWEPLPTCIEPKDLTANPAIITADLTWTEQGSATSWVVEYGSPGFTLGTGTTVVATTNNPYTLTGLTASTNYSYYVRSACSATDSSSWEGPVNFKTFCAAAVAPITESFDASGTPTCWSQTAAIGGPWRTGGTPGYGANTATDHTGNGGNFIWLDQSGTDVAVTLNSYLVDVSALTNPYVEFYYYTNNTSDGAINDLMVEAWSGTAWVTIDSIHANTGGWTEFGYSLTGHTFGSNLAYVRFRAESTVVGGNAFYQDQLLDDISFKEAPSCPTPIQFAANSITANSASVTWVEQGSATQWEIEYDSTGFVQGTGTIAVTTTNPHSLTGLTQNTTYDVYVRSVCAVGDTSDWAGPLSFTTQCATVNTYPFLETFDILSPTIGCWQNQFVVGNGSWGLAVGALGGAITAPVASGYNLVFVNQFGTNSPITNVVSPVFDLTSLVQPRISFWYAQESQFGDQNFLRVLYRAAATDPWSELFADSNEVTSWTKVILDLPSSSSTYQVAFQGINNSGYRNVVDEMTIEDTPPNDLTVVAVETVTSGCGLGMDSIRAVIVNNGSVSQTGFSVGYELRGTAITPETVTSTIAAFDTLVYTFSTMANFPAPGLDSIYAYSILTGDVNTANDTVFNMIGKVQIVNTFPYNESFATGENGWLINNDVNGSWEFGNPAQNTIIGAASDTNAYVIGGLTGGYNPNEYAYVSSPCFDFISLVNPYIQLSVWWETEFNYDGANVQYSIDGGATWAVLGTVGEGVNWYTDSDIWGMDNLPAWAGRNGSGSNGWKAATYPAPMLGGMSDVKFRVVFGSDGSVQDEGFAFDDFAIFEGLELGNDTVLCTDQTLTLSPGTYDGYYWNDSSISATYYVDAAVLDEGEHQVDVVVAGTGGYKMYDTMSVTVEKPVIALGADTVVCYGTSIVLDADTGFASYLWSTTETSQTINTMGTPSGNTTYYVGGVTALGCPATDTIDVSVNTEVLVDLGVDTTFFDSTKQDTEYELDAGPGFASYNWSTGDVTQKIIVDSLNDGQITVEVTNLDGCTGSDTVTVNFVLGVNSSFAVSTLTMYPNPATDQITIDVTNFSGLDVINVTIVDITGKIVMINKLEGAGNNFNETYDVSSFATGTYFVQFEANGEVVTRQFVIK